MRNRERAGRTTRGGARLGALVAMVALLAGCAGTGAPRPENMPVDINDVFLDETMDVGQFVERFEGESRAVYAQRFAIVEALDLAPGDVVADIGAGTGFFSFLFADAVGRTGRVQAVEISPRFLEHLRAESARRGLENFDVVEGTTNSVELPTGETRVAFICDVYHHFEAPMDSLASLYEAIEPGGELVLIEFHRIEGVTPEFLLKHVRAGREVFQAEIESAGFVFKDEIELEGLDDNYVLRFTRP
ncbi:MAG: methyltransferase domain-containing protein [bacterium]|nr:methyltransferase domain-containing protein [bacterium]